MNKKIIPLLLAVFLITTACGFGFQLPERATPEPEVTDEVNVPVPSSGKARLTLSFGAGEMYLVVHADGRLTLPGVLLEGTFDLEINEQFAVMVAYVTLKVEFGTEPFTVTLLDMDAVGVVKINEEGIAGKLKLNLASSGRVPFSQMGGLGKAYEVFGEELARVMAELNERLAA